MEYNEVESYFARFSKEWTDICCFLKQFQGLDRIRIVPVKSPYQKAQDRGRAIIMLDGKRKPVMQFTNAIDAAEFVSGKPHSIRCKCGGKYKYKGYFWIYADTKEVSDVNED